MTWEPTLELRQVRRLIMRSRPSWDVASLSYVHGPSVEETHLVLQQHWRMLLVNGEYAYKWVDVPELPEETDNGLSV